MPIDRNAPPTNKLLLERGPEGTRMYAHGCVIIPVCEKYPGSGNWGLYLTAFGGGARGAYLFVFHGTYETAREKVGQLSNQLDLGCVTTLGEVIDLYELLSQKKWPNT